MVLAYRYRLVMHDRLHTILAPDTVELAYLVRALNREAHIGPIVVENNVISEVFV